MSAAPADSRTPEERVQDIAAIMQALSEAVQEALLRHKQAGNPVAIWTNGRVVWLQPEDIPT
jgi:hypothetical protein